MARYSRKPSKPRFCASPSSKKPKSIKKDSALSKPVSLPGWRVLSDETGLRLPNFILKHLSKEKQFSLRQIKILIEKGCCKINGKVERFASRKVKDSEIVSFIFDATMLEPIQEKVVLDRESIVFEDDYLVAYDKPAGLACAPVEHDDQNNLRAYLEKFLGVPALIMVHRLDKDTSGIILYAKQEDVAQHLLEMFKERQIQKFYEAIVDGIVEEEEGSIDKKMLLKSKGPGWEKWGVTDSLAGKTAITRFQRQRTYEKAATLLEVKPLTGRTHQIRVHLASIGHPVLGDQFYGRNFLCQAVFSGHLLHARALHFRHPITQENLVLRTKKPKRFLQAEQKILQLNHRKEKKGN